MVIYSFFIYMQRLLALIMQFYHVHYYALKHFITTLRHNFSVVNLKPIASSRQATQPILSLPAPQIRPLLTIVRVYKLKKSKVAVNAATLSEEKH